MSLPAAVCHHASDCVMAHKHDWCRTRKCRCCRGKDGAAPINAAAGSRIARIPTRRLEMLRKKNVNAFATYARIVRVSHIASIIKAQFMSHKFCIDSWSVAQWVSFFFFFFIHQRCCYREPRLNSSTDASLAAKFEFRYLLVWSVLLFIRFLVSFSLFLRGFEPCFDPVLFPFLIPMFTKFRVGKFSHSFD